METRAITKSILVTIITLVTSVSLGMDIIVENHQKINDIVGNFTGTLDDTDYFGCDVSCIGDLDNDGVEDIAVGANGDDDGGSDRGSVWILFMEVDGTVKSHQKISSTAGNFTGALSNGDLFGSAVESLGDIDSDGVSDIAVGAIKDDDGGLNHGAVWILFLNSDGTVKASQKISDTEGGFTGPLVKSSWFGASVAAIGDMDDDGLPELAVGSTGYNRNGHGAVWILFLDADGTVKSHQEISDTSGGFTGVLEWHDHFGSSIAPIGDLDEDGIVDLAVGAPADDDGGSDRGAVWILFLNPDGTVKKHQKISSVEGNFLGVLDDGDAFGQSVASLGDMDNDGTLELLVGAIYDDDGNVNSGAIWGISLTKNGTVEAEYKISNASDSLGGILSEEGYFGNAVASVGDLNGDGTKEIVAGACGDGNKKGAIYVLFMAPTEVTVDIKPGSCPNPLNLASRGVLPVAILGTEDFDVTGIDMASIRLEGVSPVRSNYEDVATPVTDGNECECNTEGPDGYLDLTLKFKTQQVAEEIVNSLGDISAGDELVLTLTGTLTDGTPIVGEDCVVIVGKTPRCLAARKSDLNEDGIVNILDFSRLSKYWLEVSGGYE